MNGIKNYKILKNIKFVKIKFIIINLFFIYFEIKNINYNDENENPALMEIEKRYRIGSKNLNYLFPKVNLESNKIPSLNEIFNSRTLFISDSNITGKYIRYIRPINNKLEKKYKNKYSKKEIKITPDIFKNKKKGKYSYKQFIKLCLEEKFIYKNKIGYNNKPIISVIVPTYNKGNFIMKSIRSIQNQSFKNIEIVIINDCSTDNTSKYFNNLLKTDPRIRIFTHLKNMGVWRTRIDGILYSRGKYILTLESGDPYEDNYVLEDAYNIMEKYNLDTSKFIYRSIKRKDIYYNLNNSIIPIHVYNKSKIVYGSENIEKYNNEIMKTSKNIWTSMIRANIFIKGLYLLNDIVLNLYKNLWEDLWWNIISQKVSFSHLIYERIGYIYIQDEDSYGNPYAHTEEKRDKMIKEFLEFLYFDYNMLPKNNNKNKIINKLKQYNNNIFGTQLKFLKSKFYILNDLLSIFII